MLRPSVLAIVVLGLALPPAGVAAQCLPPAPDSMPSLARTDHDVTGDRVVAGCGPLDGSVLDVELRGTPAWILPDPSDSGAAWFVVLEDGTIDRIIDDGRGAADVIQTEIPSLELGEPPLAMAKPDGEVLFGSALDAPVWFTDPLPDSRVTDASGHALVALAGATDRYDHGVLGDALEASAVEVRDDVGNVTRIEVGADEVIEGTSAMVLELVEGNVHPELLVTVSDAADGARLRAYDLEGKVIAESEPIGRGYRWMHQIGAGRLAPDGELELIAVRTPHIGGVVQAYRLTGGRFELVASADGYSSHQLGSPNLDMALLADADGDGRLDVVVPTQSMDELALLARTDDGFEELGRLPLDGRLLTNVAAAADADGRLLLAAATDDGKLRIFR